MFSLVRPKQVLNDIWRASDPGLPPEQGDTWRRRPVAELLGWWWLSFLASVFVRSITTEAVHAAADLMLLGLLPEQFERFQPSAGMQVLADLLTVLCGLLALRVVRRTTARQQAGHPPGRHRRHRPPLESRPNSQEGPPVGAFVCRLFVMKRGGVVSRR